MDKEYLGYPLVIERIAFKRQIRLQVHLNSTIKVTSGKLVTQKQIYNFLDKNKNWICDVQNQHQELRNRYPQKRFHLGECYPYLGNDMPLRWQASKGKDVRFTFTKDELLGECPSGKKITQVECQKALIKCYENAGRKWLMCRVELWQNEMRLFAKKISVRSQKTRWGSCSSEGCISLNWRLLAAPLPVMDYVVIHELAHLKFHDHSQQFWNLVAQYDSQYKYHRKWLREHQWAFDFLALKSELHIGSI